MSAEILPFRADTPTNPVQRPVPQRALPRGRRTYSLADMVRLCGLEGYEQRTAIEHLRIKARQQGLPLPRNTRLHSGRVITGPDTIGARSLWDALLVDDWLDRPCPPGGGLAVAVSHRPALDTPRRLGVAARAAAVARR